MPTNPIGAGTCNVPVNMPMDARLVLGRLAFAQNISTGELIRRLIAQALPRVDRKSAKEFRRLVSHLVVLAAGLVVVGLQFSPAANRMDMVRARCGRGRSRQETETLCI